MPRFSGALPLRIALIGTGYAAKLRAETLGNDDRSKLVGVAGHTPERTQEFGHIHRIPVFNAWQELVRSPQVDLVIVSGVNADHEPIVRAALTADKHVIVEYPLALNAAAGAELLALAQQRDRLLHVEHIELLGGVHQAFIQALPEIGTPFFARYVTVTPQTPAPAKWTYHRQLFGFPLVAGLSRVHRLTHVFGAVETVSCQNRTWDSPHGQDYYSACWCVAQLQFRSGLRAELVYGKGDRVWSPERKLEVHGEKGTLVFEGEQGVLVNGGGRHPVEVGQRRGLFVKDTTLVLNHLLHGDPLYVTPQESLYTLAVADAAQRSATSGQPVHLPT